MDEIKSFLSKDIVVQISTWILVLFNMLFIFSCKTTKYVPVREYHSDTIRISSHDTIIVKQHAESISIPLPSVYISNVTKDTVSILKDGLYKSVASIKDGLLHHNLFTLPNAKIDTKVNATDSTMIHHDALNINRVDSIKVPYPVVKDKIVYSMHWWQKGPYYLGWVAILIICIYIITWLIKKNILHL
jgi:hypothetical protein